MADEQMITEKAAGARKSKGGGTTKGTEGTASESPLHTGQALPEVRDTAEEESAHAVVAPEAVLTYEMIGMGGQQRLQEIVNDLKGLDSVTDDKGQEVEFGGAAKEAFLKDVEGAYPVLNAALSSLYETGKFLYEVRDRQKKHNLWMKYQEVIGQSPSFINNYIRVYEKFRERLPEFSHLGVSKLEVVARLKEPVAYIEANQEFIEKAPFKEVRKSVTAEKTKGIKRSSQKREDRVEEVGSYRLRLSSNGRSFTVSNLNKEIQDELLNIVKEHLSQKK